MIALAFGLGVCAGMGVILSCDAIRALLKPGTRESHDHDKETPPRGWGRA